MRKVFPLTMKPTAALTSRAKLPEVPVLSVAKMQSSTSIPVGACVAPVPAIPAVEVRPDRAAAEFWIRYPDPVYLAQVLERVNDAARGAALATGKVTLGAVRKGMNLAKVFSRPETFLEAHQLPVAAN